MWYAATGKMASAAALEEFIVALGANRRTTYSYVAALSFLAYDVILSLGQEIKYIWGAKLSPVTALYFIVRYYGLLNLIAIVGVDTSTNLSVPVCQQYFKWTIPGGPSLFIVILDGILLLRVYALYNRSKRVLLILLVLVIGDFASALYATITLANDLASGVIAMPAPWQGCAAKVPQMTFVLTAYVPNFTLSLLFLGMTLWKLIQNHQRIYGKLTWKNLRTTGNISPLLFAFVRDGSFFFALASTATFIGLLPTFVVGGPAGGGFLPWTLAVYSYSGAHLILKLRAVGTKGNADQTWNETMSVQYHPGEGRPGITFA